MVTNDDGTRLWYRVDRRGLIAGVEALTDEKALEMLERHVDLRPVGGADQLLDELSVVPRDQVAKMITAKIKEAQP